MSGDHMLSFQDYGPSGAYPSQSQGFGPLPLTAAWAQTVLKGKHMIVRKSNYE